MLEEEYKKKSLIALQERQPDMRDDAGSQHLLKEVNEIAALAYIALNRQSETFITELFRQIECHKDKEDMTGLPIQIYGVLSEILDRESEDDRRNHRNQGVFDEKHIHVRGRTEQMQNHDMGALMPEPTGHIEVLGTVDRLEVSARSNQQSKILVSLKEGIDLALQNENIKHIIIPVGPGHRRGVYLTKPATPDEKYNVEVFDPFGSGGAMALASFVETFLSHSGIGPEKQNMTFSGPLKPQRDGYACGDFTCAYSHRMMKQFGAPEEAYNQALIDVLDEQGNAGGVLRGMTRSIFDELFPEEKKALGGVPQRKKKKPKASEASEASEGFKAFETSDVPQKGNDKNEVDWIFYFKCFGALAMLAGGVMLAVGLWVSIPMLAIGGVCVLGMGFFTLNQFSDSDSGKASQFSPV